MWRDYFCTYRNDREERAPRDIGNVPLSVPTDLSTILRRRILEPDTARLVVNTRKIHHVAAPGSARCRSRHLHHVLDSLIFSSVLANIRTISSDVVGTYADDPFDARLDVRRYFGPSARSKQQL